MVAHLIVTNNPKVRQLWTAAGLAEQFELCWVEGNLLEVLSEARKACQNGARLITHPLSGSIKPNQTPVKTIVLTKDTMPSSHDIITAENCWHMANALCGQAPARPCAGRVYEDLCLVDLTLFQSFLDLEQGRE